MKKLILSLIIISIISACGDKNKDYLVKIKTKHGDMTVLLYDETPLHKKNFLELARAGKYDSTIFHRIVQDFMIQGGDVAKKEGKQETEKIPAEIVDGLYHVKGALAAAREGDQTNPEKKSSASQFYIIDGWSWDFMTTDVRLLNQKMGELLQDTAYSDLLKQFQELARNRDNAGMTALAIENKELVEEKYNIDLSVDPSEIPEAYHGVGGYPGLDGEYTVFGKVVEGLEVIDKIAATPTTRNPQTGERSVPTENISVSMEVIEMKKKEVTEKYGYEYPSES